MPKTIITTEMQLLAAEYAALGKRPVYLDVPPDYAGQRIKLSVEAMEAGKSVSMPATAVKRAKVFRCATANCGRTFDTQFALNIHRDYESGKRKPAGIAATAKRKRGRPRGR